ncbi:unnamed protein product, partial [marine sediment metagenome]
GVVPHSSILKELSQAQAETRMLLLKDKDGTYAYPEFIASIKEWMNTHYQKFTLSIDDLPEWVKFFEQRLNIVLIEPSSSQPDNPALVVIDKDNAQFGYVDYTSETIYLLEVGWFSLIYFINLEGISNCLAIGRLNK